MLKVNKELWKLNLDFRLEKVKIRFADIFKVYNKN